METVKLLILIIVISFCSLAQVAGATVSTPAQIAANGIEGAIQIYAEENNGSFPASWEELDGFMFSRQKNANTSLARRSYFFTAIDDRLGGRLEENFVLLSESNRIEVHLEDTRANVNPVLIVAYMSRPVEEDRRNEVGRYVIWKGGKNRIKSSWWNEGDIRNIFLEAGLEIESGKLRKEPPTFNIEAARIAREYAQAHFADPDHPTEKEIVGFKKYLSEKYGDKVNSIDHVFLWKMDSSEQSETKPKSVESLNMDQQQIYFPWIWIGLIVAIFGVVAFLVFQRKSA